MPINFTQPSPTAISTWAVLDDPVPVDSPNTPPPSYHDSISYASLTEALYKTGAVSKKKAIAPAQPPLEINTAAKGSGPWKQITSHDELVALVDSGVYIEYRHHTMGKRIPLEPSMFFMSGVSDNTIQSLIATGVYAHNTQKTRLVAIMSYEKEDGSKTFRVRSTSSPFKLTQYAEEGWEIVTNIQWHIYDNSKDVILS